jgi:hypothetical protein
MRKDKNAGTPERRNAGTPDGRTARRREGRKAGTLKKLNAANRLPLTASAESGMRKAISRFQVPGFKIQIGWRLKAQ